MMPSVWDKQESFAHLLQVAGQSKLITHICLKSIFRNWCLHGVDDVRTCAAAYVVMRSFRKHGVVFHSRQNTRLARSAKYKTWLHKSNAIRSPA